MIQRLVEKRNLGKKIGITFSQFDLFHAGHASMLAECKLYCEYLIVGLQNDASKCRKEKNSPVQSIVERQIILGSCSFVDDIITYNSEKDLEDILLTLPLDVRFLGKEYANKEFTGKEICRRRNISVIYNSRDHEFSSSELRKKVAIIETEGTRA